MKILSSLLVTACLVAFASAKESVIDAIEGFVGNEQLRPSLFQEQAHDVGAPALSNFTQTSTSDSSTRVAVIGCGPGGMFFLHALATKRKKLVEKGDTEALANFPQVTVFEKTRHPGGVWRPHSNVSGTTDMMGGLWSNSPSFDMEFFDYTYADHFENESMPLYLPRKHLLEYMLARVTSVEDIFQHVQFHTQVVNVKYKKNRFVVRIKDLDTKIKSAHDFDKVVLAGGIQSAPYYPTTIQTMLNEGGFVGEDFHSSEIVELDKSIHGKRVVLVGDSYSAEDLALQSLKVGASRVFMTSARQVGEASNTNSWPDDKVTNLKCLPTAVIHNGTGLLCHKVKWDDDIGGYAPVKRGYSKELSDIDIVIYCTGYTTRQTYLDKSLRYKCKDREFSVDSDWRSQPNSLTRNVGTHVTPDDQLDNYYVCNNIYHHHLIQNPNMMYIRPSTPYYLPEIDAIAWSLASYVTGEVVLPSKREMEMQNYLQSVQELSIPHLRRSMDDNYRVTKLKKTYRSTETREVGYDEFFKEYIRYNIRLIARDQVTGGHGGGWGSYDKLSERGELLVEQFAEEEFVRDETRGLRSTFRDVDPSPYKSLYTGVTHAPLKGNWMDLDDDGNPIMSR